MKKTLFLLSIVSGLFFLPFSQIQAHEHSPAEKFLENREEREENKAERKEERQNKTKDRQENRQERRDEMAEKIATRLEERFSRHEKRLKNWIERVTKHISKREENGKDMTAAKAALVTAQKSLESAIKLGQEAVTLFESITAEKWSEQKQDAQKAREAVKKAQVAFAQVVKDMKVVLNELKKGTE